MDYGHAKRYELHSAFIWKSIETTVTRKGQKSEGWIYVMDAYKTYTAWPLPPPHRHLTYRQFNTRIKKLADEDKIDRHIISEGRYGVRSLIRPTEHRE